jgi:hypothetical protein
MHRLKTNFHGSGRTGLYAKSADNALLVEELDSPAGQFERESPCGTDGDARTAMSASIFVESDVSA